MGSERTEEEVRSLRRTVRDRAEEGFKKGFSRLDKEVTSFVWRKRIFIPGLPLNFVKLAALEREFSERPPAIAFPFRMMISQFAQFFLSVAASFAFMKSYGIIPASVLLFLALVYNSYSRKIAKALLLSAVRIRLFSAALFIIGAAVGMNIRFFIFGRGW